MYFVAWYKYCHELKSDAPQEPMPISSNEPITTDDRNEACMQTDSYSLVHIYLGLKRMYPNLTRPIHVQ